MNIKKTVWVVVRENKPIKTMDTNTLIIFTCKKEAKRAISGIYNGKYFRNYKIKKAFLEVHLDS